MAAAVAVGSLLAGFEASAELVYVGLFEPTGSVKTHVAKEGCFAVVAADDLVVARYVDNVTNEPVDQRPLDGTCWFKDSCVNNVCNKGVAAACTTDKDCTLAHVPWGPGTKAFVTNCNSYQTDFSAQVDVWNDVPLSLVAGDINFSCPTDNLLAMVAYTPPAGTDAVCLGTTVTTVCEAWLADPWTGVYDWLRWDADGMVYTAAGQILGLLQPTEPTSYRCWAYRNIVAYDHAGRAIYQGDPRPCNGGVTAPKCPDGVVYKVGQFVQDPIDTWLEVSTNSVPTYLWPPNHRYRDFSGADLAKTCGIKVTRYSACGPPVDLDPSQYTIKTTGVLSSQVEDDQLDKGGENGDGATLCDATVSGSGFSLRSERTGSSKIGRTYQVHFQVDGADGGQAGAGACLYLVNHSVAQLATPDFNCGYCVAGTNPSICGSCPQNLTCGQ